MGCFPRVGSAFHCSIMPLKALNSASSGTYADIADAIYFAADHGAQVINMSLGGTFDSVTLYDAVVYAYVHGVTVVCAAGNDYLNGNPPSFPAAYHPYCVAVGATRFDQTRAYYSNTGDYIDLVAPGRDLNMDQNHDGYGDGVLQQTFNLNPTSFAYYFMMGTSMAAPHVSGVAALLISQGVTGPTAARRALQHSTRDLGTPGWDPQYGWGLLDAQAALTYVPGDLTGDHHVNGADLVIFMEQWLNQEPPRLTANFNDDMIVDLGDFAILAQHWGL